MRYTLWVHDAKLSKEDLLLKADTFPNIKQGDIIELYNPDANPLDSCKLVLLVESPLDKAILNQKGQVSICRQIAEVSDIESNNSSCFQPVFRLTLVVLQPPTIAR